MMDNRLEISDATWEKLQQHLLQNDVEQAAIMFAQPEVSETGVVFRERQVLMMRPTDFSFQSEYHFCLTDEAQNRIIRTAWDTKTAIVEFHSHVGEVADAEFSASDLSGFGEFVPHVWWRLRGVPYAAIVTTRSEFDALVWRQDPKVPEGLSGIDTPSAIRRPSGHTLTRRGRRYGRSI